MSRTPLSAICKVRGIGVAVSVSTWASALSRFRRSLWVTPKCCSSSTTIRPRSLKTIDSPSSAWVPITMSISPGRQTPPHRRLLPGRHQARQLRDAHRQPGEALIEGLQMLPAEQRPSVSARRPACRPEPRETPRGNATSVLPKPTSPHTSRVHRPAGAEVGDRLVDGARLILGLDIGKARAEGSYRAPGAASTGAGLVARAAASLMSWSAISRMRCLSFALRACHAAPPSRSNATGRSAEP